METLKRFEKAVDEHLSLRSFPVAIKLLKLEEDVPINMGRPLKDLGEPISPCQGWHLARHSGLSVAMLKEDFATSCPSGPFVFGLLEPTQEWNDGDLSYGIYTGSRQAARNMEKHVFRLEVDKYRGVAYAPLGKANFTPDLVMIFCNSKDARRLTLASAWATGQPLEVSIFARDLCSEGVVQPFQTGRPVIAIPCGGDRRRGETNDDEIVFTTPVDRFEVIIRGLESHEQAHHVENLGEDRKLTKRYKEMAKVLNGKLGRGAS